MNKSLALDGRLRENILYVVLVYIWQKPGESQEFIRRKEECLIFWTLLTVCVWYVPFCLLTNRRQTLACYLLKSYVTFELSTPLSIITEQCTIVSRNLVN